MDQQLITSERLILADYLNRNAKFPTDVKRLKEARFKNPVSQEEIGNYRPWDKRKCVTADLEIIQEFVNRKEGIPGFLEAGPRENLAFDIPNRGGSLKATIVTSGGLAPGLNSVVHSIVERHMKTYSMLIGSAGGVWGFLDSFKGMDAQQPQWIKLDVDTTERWLDLGGSQLGSVRYKKDEDLDILADRIAKNLERWGVDILYVIGGDGSLTTAHKIAEKTQRTIVVGIPKTMDNDILWVWQSFGFNTSVEYATSFINIIHSEAESTRRISVVELFGAQSGFVAANATLASGHVDLVMIPEVFEPLTKQKAEEALQAYADYLDQTIKRKENNPHAVIVIAEGVGKMLADKSVMFGDQAIKADSFPDLFSEELKKITNIAGEPMATFTLKPRYYIRAVPANPQDQIYCKRLGALAVDNALAGFTDFMISQWLTEYVLVPLDLVAGGQKRVPPGGIFWKQVIQSTGQPNV